jgi:tetratricopeptide (TPR) repeat protein
VGSKYRLVRLNCACALLLIAASAPLWTPSALSQQAPESAEVETLRADVDRLYREGRIDEAILVAERALSIQERALGPSDPRVVKAMNGLAWLYRAAGDYSGAEALFERVLEITTAAVGPRDPVIAITINNLGLLYWEKGDHERAAKYLEKALSIWERALGPDHADVAVSLGNLASFYQQMGDLGRAEPLYERALAIWDKTSDPGHRQLVDTLNRLGAIRKSNGDYDSAESLFNRALALDEKARVTVVFSSSSSLRAAASQPAPGMHFSSERATHSRGGRGRRVESFELAFAPADRGA